MLYNFDNSIYKTKSNNHGLFKHYCCFFSFTPFSVVKWILTIVVLLGLTIPYLKIDPTKHFFFADKLLNMKTVIISVIGTPALISILTPIIKLLLNLNNKNKYWYNFEKVLFGVKYSINYYYYLANVITSAVMLFLMFVLVNNIPGEKDIAGSNRHTYIISILFVVTIFCFSNSIYYIVKTRLSSESTEKLSQIDKLSKGFELQSITKEEVELLFKFIRNTDNLSNYCIVASFFIKQVLNYSFYNKYEIYETIANEIYSSTHIIGKNAEGTENTLSLILDDINNSCDSVVENDVLMFFVYKKFIENENLTFFSNCMPAKKQLRYLYPFIYIMLDKHNINNVEDDNVNKDIRMYSNLITNYNLKVIDDIDYNLLYTQISGIFEYMYFLKKSISIEQYDCFTTLNNKQNYYKLMWECII